jgi:lipopolysaccharide-induced tumor necrosis factor-alpha factor
MSRDQQGHAFIRQQSFGAPEAQVVGNAPVVTSEPQDVRPRTVVAVQPPRRNPHGAMPVVQATVVRPQAVPTVQGALVPGFGLIQQAQLDCASVVVAVPQQAMEFPLGGNMMGRVPRTGRCPHCAARVTTSLSFVAGSGTICLSACLLLWFWPCTCVPCFVDSCKEVRHTCPSCNRIVGTDKFLF